MLVISWSQFLKENLPLEQKLASMTIGVFDGVHRGHQALIKRVVSHNTDYVPVIITFRNIQKKNAPEGERQQNGETPGEILSFKKRIEIFEQLGVQITIVVDFTESFRHIKGVEFLETLIKHGNIGFLAVGKSFRCGYQLDTDAESVKKFFTSHKIKVEIVKEVMEGALPISSSRIRVAIAGGNLLLVESMLGRPLQIASQVLNTVIFKN